MNYFRDFIPGYSTLAAPLESLRKSPVISENDWTEKHRRAFDGLKAALHQGMFLSFPDFAKRFIVATDASDVGIGAVLYQLANDQSEDRLQNRNWICFSSRALHPSERNYSTTRKELLVIVFALKKFHYYIWGRSFSLYTDHRALTYLFLETNLSPIMYNWLDVILSYDFTIIHRPGDLNVLPDALSRLYPSTKLDTVPTSIPHLSMATIAQ